MAHPNEELLRRYFKATESEDLATLDELFADNITAHIGGRHALSRDFQGKEAVFGFFGQLAERSGGTARLHLQDALTDDWFRRGAGRAHGHGRGRGTRWRTRGVGPAHSKRLIRRALEPPLRRAEDEPRLVVETTVQGKNIGPWGVFRRSNGRRRART